MNKSSKEILPETIQEMYTQALLDDLAPNVFTRQIMSLLNAEIEGKDKEIAELREEMNRLKA